MAFYVSEDEVLMDALASKINYLDPRYVFRLRSRLRSNSICRITVAWCKTHDVPVEKLFSKTLITKCT